MGNPLTISLLCGAIFCGNLIWGFIADESFPDSMQRTFLMVLGALKAYFVIV